MNTFLRLLLILLITFVACENQESILDALESPDNPQIDNGTNRGDNSGQFFDEVKLYPIFLNARYGYINENGVVVIDPVHRFAGKFSNGLARISNGSSDFINEKGEIVIDGKGMFSTGGDFSEGLAAVRIENRWTFINTKGEIQFNPKYRQVSSFKDGRALVRSLSYRDWHYIDTNGNRLDEIDFRLDQDQFEHPHFNSGRALVMNDINDQYGFIDREMNPITGFNYTEARPFSDSLAAIKISDRWGYINVDGEIAITPKFISAGDFSEGLAPARVQSNLFGYVDRAGELVIEEKFEEAHAFTEGRAAAKLNDLWGIIDTQGNWVLQPQYDEIDPFYNGLARVMELRLDGDDLEEYYGYVDRNGRIIWYPTR